MSLDETDPGVCYSEGLIRLVQLDCFGVFVLKLACPLSIYHQRSWLVCSIRSAIALAFSLQKLACPLCSAIVSVMDVEFEKSKLVLHSFIVNK